MPLVTAASSRVRSRSLLVVTALATVAVFGLAGCAQEPAPAPSADSTASATPSQAPSDEPSAEPTETIEPGTPVTISCEELLTLDDLYAFNPNISADPAFAPAAGSLAAAAVADNGIACGYLNQTSGEVMNFAVAQPSEASLTAALNAAVSSSKPVPTYGVPPAVNGFFNPETGEVQIFTPKYWLTATSTMFAEPGDVGDLVDVALSHLPE